MWAANLSEMGSLFPTNQGVKYLLCVIDVFTKYAWSKPWKGKKAKTVLHGFVEIESKSKRKPINNGLIREQNFIITLCKKFVVGWKRKGLYKSKLPLNDAISPNMKYFASKIGIQFNKSPLGVEKNNYAIKL